MKNTNTAEKNDVYFNRENTNFAEDYNTYREIETRKESRIASIKELGNAYQYFSVRRDDYEKLDDMKEWIENTKNGAVGLLVGIFLNVIAFISVYDVSDSRYGICMDDVAFILFLFAIAGALIYRFVHIFKKKARYKVKIENLENDLIDYYNAYGYCPLGYEYSKPEIIHILADYVRKGRADTTKEALEIMFKDLHNQIVEDNVVLCAQALNNRVL